MRKTLYTAVPGTYNYSLFRGGSYRCYIPVCTAWPVLRCTKEVVQSVWESSDAAVIVKYILVQASLLLYRGNYELYFNWWLFKLVTSTFSLLQLMLRWWRKMRALDNSTVISMWGCIEKSGFLNKWVHWLTLHVWPESNCLGWISRGTTALVRCKRVRLRVPG